MTKTKTKKKTKVKKVKAKAARRVATKRSNNRNIEVLEPKHKHFCNVLLTDPDMNPVQAWIDAGFGDNRITAKAGSKALMDCKVIQVEVKRLINLRSERLDITSDRVLFELKKLAFADLGDYLTYDNDSMTLKSSDEVDTSVVSSVKRRVTTNKREKTKTGTVTIELKLYDKLKALELVARHLGMMDRNLIVGDVQIKVKLPKDVTIDGLN